MRWAMVALCNKSCDNVQRLQKNPIRVGPPFWSVIFFLPITQNGWRNHAFLGNAKNVGSIAHRMPAVYPIYNVLRKAVPKSFGQGIVAPAVVPLCGSQFSWLSHGY